jgi:hypothetical protein
MAPFDDGVAIAKAMAVGVSMSPTGIMKTVPTTITAGSTMPILTAGQNQAILNRYPMIQAMWQELPLSERACRLVQLEAMMIHQKSEVP